jgi:O-antigen/teichoic acid export membrane protein
MIGRLLSITPLYMVWSSQMYTVAQRDDAALQFGKYFTRMLALYVYVGLGLTLFSGEVVSILGDGPYATAVPFVAPVVLAYGMHSAATLMDAGFFLRRQMGRKLIVTLIATLVMALFYLVLIPPFGAMGAALASLGGFTALMLLTYWATQPIFFVAYEYGRLFALLFVGVGAWVIGQSLPVWGWGIVGKGALLLFTPALAWWTGLVTQDEKQHTRLLLRSLVVWSRSPQRSTAEVAS